jgi:pseudouridine synthase
MPEQIRVTIDGQPQKRPAAITVALHKPRGVVTTRRDPQGRPTVYSLIADLDAHVVPVGRLDVATSGLLLLTNDTRFAEWLTNPDNEVPRVYVVTVRGRVTPEAVEHLQRGVTHSDEQLVARSVIVRKSSTRESLLIIELVEGRNREIRRMMQVIGHEVTRLRRVQFGGLSIEGLPPGRWRIVSRAELRRAFPNARSGYLRRDQTAVK